MNRTVGRSQSARGFVSISIDVESPIRSASVGQRPMARDTNVEAVAAELLARFNRRSIAATWSFNQPGEHPLATKIRGSQVPHEIALLGGSLAQMSRVDFKQTVIDRIQAAAKKQIPISTLALTDVSRLRHIDLLTKYGLTMIRNLAVDAAESLRTVCYGLWQVPVGISLCGGGWMANQTQSARARRILQRAAQYGGVSHVRIDSASLAQTDSFTALRMVDRLIADIDQMRSGGALAVETLRETALRLQPKRTIAAARSILRAA